MTKNLVMKFYVCVYILLYLLFTGSAQPRFGRPHPLYNRQQNNADNFLAAALLFGGDFSEMPLFPAANPRQMGGGGNVNFALRNLAIALGLGPNLGMPPSPFARQRARQDMNTLSMLGLIDGPDAPDPGQGKAAGKRGRNGLGPRKAGAGGGAEGPEAAPAKKKPRRRGPRRRKPAKAAPPAKK